jgi:hypothetical protein
MSRVEEDFQSQRLSPRPRVSSAIRHPDFLLEPPTRMVPGLSCLISYLSVFSQSFAKLVLSVAEVGFLSLLILKLSLFETKVLISRGN